MVLFLALSACQGDAGPMGPTGPAGPAGPPGPGTRIILSALVAASGTATSALPSEAGSLLSPPGLSCYISSPGSTVLLLISTDTYSEISCGLVSSGGTLFAQMVGAPAGWTARFAVVF